MDRRPRRPLAERRASRAANDDQRTQDRMWHMLDTVDDILRTSILDILDGRPPTRVSSRVYRLMLEVSAPGFTAMLELGGVPDEHLLHSVPAVATYLWNMSNAAFGHAMARPHLLNDHRAWGLYAARFFLSTIVTAPGYNPA